MKFELAYLVAQLFLTVEIVFRRWVWGQVPSQFGATVVYALVAFNFALIFWRFKLARTKPK